MTKKEIETLDKTLRKAYRTLTILVEISQNDEKVKMNRFKQSVGKTLDYLDELGEELERVVIY